MKARKSAVVAGLMMVAMGVSAGDEGMRLTPTNFEQIGTVQSMDLVARRIQIDGVKYHLSLTFKVHPGLLSNPQRSRKLQIGDRVGFIASNSGDKHTPAVEAVWLQDAN